MNNDQPVFNSNQPQPLSQPQVQVQQANPPIAQVPVINQQQKPIMSQPVGGSGKGSKFRKIFKILIVLLVTFGFIGLMMFALSIFPKNSSSTAGNGQVKLTYWGLLEDPSVMQGIISDFEKQNPKITVEYSKQDINQYKQRLDARIAAGTGPDIFRFHNTWYPMLSKILLPLPNDTISKEEFARNYYPVVQKDLIKNGAIYGIPLEIDTLSLFINTALFQTAGLSRPVTWNDFINAARVMTVKDENKKIKTAGAGIGTYDNVTHAPDILSLLFLQNGVDFKNITASSDRIQGAFNFYTSFAKDESAVWDNTLDPTILAFSKGNLGMFFGYSWDFYTIKQFNPNLNFQIVPVPQLPNQNVTLASYWAEGVSARSKNQKEALLFMKYLARKDIAQRLYAEESKTRLFGEPYARIDLADNLKDNPNAYTFVSQAPDAQSSFFVDSTNDSGLNQQLNTYLGQAINSILNNGSVESEFDNFSKGILPVLGQYGE